MIDGLAIMCRNFEADPSLLSQMDLLKKDLESGLHDRREGVLAARLGPILDCIDDNLTSRSFMFTPSDQGKYYDYPLMFGAHFLTEFPKSAIVEMSEVGRCYACGRWTACAFHCMRVAEYGLRRLFKIAGAKLPVQGVRTPSPKQVRYPIEYATWNIAINQIKRKIDMARKLPTGRKREERLRLFSDLADHCEYMKDIWRNELSHTRRIYNKEDALSVVVRLQGFMRLVMSSSARPALRTTGTDHHRGEITRRRAASSTSRATG